MSAGSDIIGVSATGSGKTLAFMVPAIDSIMKVSKLARMQVRGKVCPHLLVIAPTRELASQILDEGNKVAGTLGLRATSLYGGVPYPPQIAALGRGVHWVVATPGRLNDHLEKGRVRLGDITTLVFDEADQMLDAGFEPQLRQIMTHMPPKRQTVMFTATWPLDVQQLASDFLQNPVHVQIGESSKTNNPNITQQFRTCKSERERIAALVDCLRSRGATEDRTIVFVNTKAKCATMQDDLVHRRHDCVTINGDMEQAEREKSLSAFKACKPAILVATDVAARGLDIPDVRLVVSYDLSVTPDLHIHRIGRTGRANAKGLAVTLVNPFDKQELRVATSIAAAMADAGQPVHPELKAVLDCAPVDRDAAMEDELDERSLVSGYTHNTGLTHPNVELQGHQLARILASDRAVVEETIRRGLRFMNVERSKAADDRFRRPKWRIRRVVPWEELEESATRHRKGQEALRSLIESLGGQPVGVVHAVVADLYDPTSYIATEMFEIPQLSEQMWQIYDQICEMLTDSDEADFAHQVVSNHAFVQALKAMWEGGDTDEEYYWQTFSKLPFKPLNNLPLLHYLCEDGTFDNTIHFLLNGYSHQTAESPWLRLVDVEMREKRYGNTPFHICAYAGRLDLLKLFLGHAQRYCLPIGLLRTTKGETILDVAQARGNMECYNLLAPFFPHAQIVPGAIDASKRESWVIMDGPERPGGEAAARIQQRIPAHLSLRELTACLRSMAHDLREVPTLVLIKHAHFTDMEPAVDDMFALLDLVSSAVSFTGYHCTSQSLQLSTHFLTVLADLYQRGNPSFERVFFFPPVRGDPSEEQREAFTAASEGLLQCLRAKSQEGRLRLHSFGRDGSSGYTYPAAPLTKRSLADLLGGVLHVNIFIAVRKRIEQKLQEQVCSAVHTRKRTKQGRSIGEEDVRQPYFFAVKWAMLDRFCYNSESIDVNVTSRSSPSGLRAAVDADRFIDVASELIKMWMYPLTCTMPDALYEFQADYIEALDIGLWSLLEHHRLLPALQSLVAGVLSTLTTERQEQLQKTAAWMQKHSRGAASA